MNRQFNYWQCTKEYQELESILSKNKQNRFNISKLNTNFVDMNELNKYY